MSEEQHELTGPSTEQLTDGETTPFGDKVETIFELHHVMEEIDERIVAADADGDIGSSVKLSIELSRVQQKRNAAFTAARGIAAEIEKITLSRPMYGLIPLHSPRERNGISFSC